MKKFERWSPKDIRSRGRDTSQNFSCTRISGDGWESQSKEPDSGNEPDIKPEAEEECLWELDPLVTSINKLDVNNTADDVSEWYINEELDLAYLSRFASDSVPSDTSTDVGDDPWSAIDALTSLHVPVRSYLMANQGVSDVQESLVKVQQDAKAKDWSFSKELSPNQWLGKVLKAIMNPLNLPIMNQMYSKWWKIWGMI